IDRRRAPWTWTTSLSPCCSSLTRLCRGSRRSLPAPARPAAHLGRERGRDQGSGRRVLGVGAGERVVRLLPVALRSRLPGAAPPHLRAPGGHLVAACTQTPPPGPKRISAGASSPALSSGLPQSCGRARR